MPPWPLLLLPVSCEVDFHVTIDPWGFEVYEDLMAEVGDEIVFVWEKYVEHAIHSLN